MSEPAGKALRGDRDLPPRFKGGRKRRPLPSDPSQIPHATSIRLTQEQIDFLRDQAAKRKWFSYKYPKMGSVSTMITDLVNQFMVYVNGPPKKKKKYTLK